MMQLLLYTTLYLKDQAVPYKIYFNQYEKKYFFKPDKLNLVYPSFHAWHFRNQWFFEGIEDNQLKEQAKEDVQNILQMKGKPLL